MDIFAIVGRIALGIICYFILAIGAGIVIGRFICAGHGVEPIGEEEA